MMMDSLPPESLISNAQILSICKNRLIRSVVCPLPYQENQNERQMEIFVILWEQERFRERRHQKETQTDQETEKKNFKNKTGNG